MTNTLKTKCDSEILISEQTLAHLAAHPEALLLLEEAASMVELPASGFLKTTLDFGRVIGQSACVEVLDLSAPLQFAVRTGRDVPSRVIVDQQPVDSSEFTLITGRQDDGSWVLYTGFVGGEAPREPHDQYFSDKRDSAEFKESLEFWSKFALCVSEGWGEVYTSTWEDELAKIDAQCAEA